MSRTVRFISSRLAEVPFVRTLAAVIAASLFAAGGAGAAITPSVNPVTALPGQNTQIISVSITYTVVGMNDTGTLVFTGLPPGVSTIPVPPDAGPGPVTFPISALVSSSQASFRLGVGLGVPPGTYPITLSTNPEIGAGTGLLTLVVQQPPSFSATITPNPISLTWGAAPAPVTVTTFPEGGFSDPITYSFVGFPAGITAGSTQTVGSPYSPATFGFSVAAGTMPGSYAGFLQAAWGAPLQTRTFPMTVVVQAPDIAVSFGQGVMEICNGGAPAANGVTLQPLNGYAGTPNLAFLALPVGITVAPAALVSPALPPAQAVPFSVQASGAPAGAHLLTLQVSDPAAAITKTASFTATVVDPAFTPVITPSALTVQAGGATAVLQVSLTRNACFSASTVSVAVSGAPAGVTISPAPAVLEAPAYSAVPLSVQVAPTVAAGTFPLVVTFTPAVGAARTVPVALTVTPAPDFSLGVTPASLTVTAGESANAVISVTPLNGFAGAAAVTAGVSPGLTVSPAQFQVAAGGSQSVAIVTTEATSPGSRVVQFSATAAGVAGEKLASLVVVVEPPPPVITAVAPPALAAGTSGVPVRLSGRNFRPGAVISSPSPDLVVSRTVVHSSSLAEAAVAVRTGARPGPYDLNLVNTDGTRTAQAATLLVYPTSSLAAPLGVTAAAVVFPRPFTVVSAAEPVYPRGLLATTGTGTVVGLWLLDGIPFEQFTLPVAGGMPVPVEARVPIPLAWAGEHRLELLIQQPQAIPVDPVSVIMGLDARSGLTLLGPADGSLISAGGAPVFRWSLVPGASGFELEILVQGSESPQAIRLSVASWRPSFRALSDLGLGEHRWRVRPIFPGEVRGEPTPWQRFTIVPMEGSGSLERTDGVTRAVLTSQQAGLRLTGPDGAPVGPGAEEDPRRREWEVAAQATALALEEGGSVEGDTLQAQVSARLDLGGSEAEIQVTADVAGRRDLSAPRETALESRNWQVALVAGRDDIRQEARVGYSPPSFLDQSEYLAAGLARGGGEGTLVTPFGSVSYYQTFSQMPAAAVGSFVPDQKVRAVGFQFPGDPFRMLLRVVALRSDGAPTQWSPSGRGEGVGLFGRLLLAPSLILTFEGAHGTFQERDPEEPAEKRSGEGFRLGVSGSRGTLMYSANLRRTDADFVNPVNPGFTPGGVGDRTNADLTLGRAFGRTMVTMQLNRMESGGRGADGDKATQDGAVLSVSVPLGMRVNLAFSANTAAVEGGGNASRGLPGADRRTNGVSLNISERLGAFSVSQMLGWQRVEDKVFSGANLTTTTAGLSAAGGVGRRLMLSAMLSGTRSEAGPLGGRTDQAMLSVQPTVSLGRLSVTPRAAWSRMTNDVSGSEMTMEQYQLMLQWSPPWLGELFALQVAADWNRMDSGFGPRPGFHRRVTATFSLRRTLTGAAAFAAPVAPVPGLPTA